MPAERYYQSHPLGLNEIVVLDGKEHHHLVHVMRVKLNEIVEIVNGTGVLASAQIINISKNHAELQIVDRQESSAPSWNLHLVQAITRMNRLDTILEKGTELGVTKFTLFPGEKSERNGITPSQMERLEWITISALKQSGRLYLPKLYTLSSLFELPLAPPVFYGDLHSYAPKLMEVWKDVEPGNDITFLIGPESGFSEKEHNYLKNSEALGVSLHPNILRSETAAIAACALISHMHS